jgi:hypothetical protein
MHTNNDCQTSWSYDIIFVCGVFIINNSHKCVTCFVYIAGMVRVKIYLITLPPAPKRSQRCHSADGTCKKLMFQRVPSERTVCIWKGLHYVNNKKHFFLFLCKQAFFNAFTSLKNHIAWRTRPQYATGTGSSARHKYQVATLRYGRNCSPREIISSLVSFLPSI